MNRLSSLVFLALVFVSSVLHAQTRPQMSPQAILVTIGTGDEVWEKFGHNMLWLRSPDRGIDVCYNWGLFDFDQPGFIRNFLQGRMTYWMSGFRPNDILLEYFENKRHITMQRLNLTPEQIDQAIDLCETNSQPANREYRYDYFKDNCSTRVRDMIDRVTDGSLQHLKTEYPETPHSYRWQSMRLMQDDFWMTLGVDFTLGASTDRPMTKWQECFLPEKLSIYAAPLIQSTREPWPSNRASSAEKPPIYWPWLAGVGVICSGVILFARRWKRWLGSIFIGLWWFIAGLGGVFMSYLWAFTDHTAGWANQNLWHFSPIALIGLVTLIVRWPRTVRAIALIVAAVSVVGLLLRSAMILSQQNWDFIALALPLNLTIAWIYRQAPPRPALTPEPVPSEVIASS